jgi:hypothetical protein
MRRWLTPDALREAIAVRVRLAGEQRILANACGVSPQYLCDVLSGRREPGAKLLKGLGYRRVVIYEQEPQAGSPRTEGPR